MKKHRILVIASSGVILLSVASIAVVTFSVHSSGATNLVPPVGISGTDVARAATINVALPTYFAQNPIGSIPNGATQTTAAKPIPTCASEPVVLPTPRVASAYPNDPLAIIQQTAFASAVAAHVAFIPVGTVDTAPQTPAQDKWTVTVGNTANCTSQQYLVPESSINAFTASLPSGIYVTGILAPASVPRYLYPAPSGQPVTSAIPTAQTQQPRIGTPPLRP